MRRDVLRITFELEVADNPPLYQDLAQFPKGPRRVNRLRTLAFAGLMHQSEPLSDGEGRTIRTTASVGDDMRAATQELFGPGLDT